MKNLAVLKYVGPEKKAEWGKHWIESGFDGGCRLDTHTRAHTVQLIISASDGAGLETVLTKTAGRYSVGDDITMADLCLVPQVYNAKRFVPQSTPLLLPPSFEPLLSPGLM